MRRVSLWVHDGVMASVVSGPIDVLMVANGLWGRGRTADAGAHPLFSWRIESPDGAAVRSASGQMIAVDGSIGDGAAADAVIVFGPYVGRGGDAFAAMFDRDIDGYRVMARALRARRDQGALIAAVCSGSFVMALSGLLDGRPATTHWALSDVFRARFPAVRLCDREILTEAEGILCSGAVTSHFNLALRLVDLFAGPEIAQSAGRVLLIDANRLSQASYRSLTIQERARHDDALVARAERWIEDHLGDPLGVAALADRFAVSARTLNRRFQRALGRSPVAHLQALRIDQAKRLLETTARSVDAIGVAVGYQDASAFRRLFKREAGLSPHAYRLRFARRPSAG